MRVEARRRRTRSVTSPTRAPASQSAHRDRIFDKFYRVGDGPSGTGLGLFIARGLVSAMGGRINVDSEEGHGSRFAFELPAAAGTDISADGQNSLHDDDGLRDRRRAADPPPLPRQPRGGRDAGLRGARRPERDRARARQRRT